MIWAFAICLVLNSRLAFLNGSTSVFSSGSPAPRSQLANARVNKVPWRKQQLVKTHISCWEVVDHHNANNRCVSD